MIITMYMMHHVAVVNGRSDGDVSSS